LKPYLRICTTRGKSYLAVAIHPDAKSTLVLKSFGRADVESNWLEAIDFLLKCLREYYLEKMKTHVRR